MDSPQFVAVLETEANVRCDGATVRGAKVQYEGPGVQYESARVRASTVLCAGPS